MVYVYIALAAVPSVIMAGVLIWHNGRLERRMKLSADETERLRGFRLAGGTDAQFAGQLHLEDDRLTQDAIMKRHKIGKFEG